MAAITGWASDAAWELVVLSVQPFASWANVEVVALTVCAIDVYSSAACAFVNVPLVVVVVVVVVPWLALGELVHPAIKRAVPATAMQRGNLRFTNESLARPPPRRRDVLTDRCKGRVAHPPQGAGHHQKPHGIDLVLGERLMP